MKLLLGLLILAAAQAEASQKAQPAQPGTRTVFSAPRVSVISFDAMGSASITALVPGTGRAPAGGTLPPVFSFMKSVRLNAPKLSASKLPAPALTASLMAYNRLSQRGMGPLLTPEPSEHPALKNADGIARALAQEKPAQPGFGSFTGEHRSPKREDRNNLEPWKESPKARVSRRPLSGDGNGWQPEPPRHGVLKLLAYGAFVGTFGAAAATTTDAVLATGGDSVFWPNFWVIGTIAALTAAWKKREV